MLSLRAWYRVRDALAPHGYFAIRNCNDGKSMITARFHRAAGLRVARDNVLALIALIDPTVREV
jgi:hypothetical protein